GINDVVSCWPLTILRGLIGKHSTIEYVFFSLLDSSSTILCEIKIRKRVMFMARIDGRSPNQLRSVHFIVDFLDYAEGSVLVETGKTRVLCAASVEEKVPPFLEGKGQGWVTAEYDMLPRATHTRGSRERDGRISGRTQEIQRLIGRSLRAVVDMNALGPRTITLDCDVLQADGGTRTASISGAYVALHRACSSLLQQKILTVHPVRTAVAAVSVGVVDGEILLDL